MPPVASAPPLIVVGVLMMACAKFIDWEQLDEAVPAFVVVTLLPFTYSIANGMLFGIGTWVLIKVFIIYHYMSLLVIHMLFCACL
jgi:AGZA family xanthine/uracil permease-like MFS transporter